MFSITLLSLETVAFCSKFRSFLLLLALLAMLSVVRVI